MKTAVVDREFNGVVSVWELLKQRHQVMRFEKSEVKPSEQEIEYLTNTYSHYYKTLLSKKNIIEYLESVLQSDNGRKKGSSACIIQYTGSLITLLSRRLITLRQLAESSRLASSMNAR